MKRYSLLTLLLLTITLSAFAFQDPDPKYSNLEFTVLDAEAKTVSVKGISNTSTAPIIIPSIAKDGEEGYAVTTIEDKGFYGFSNVTSITLNEGLIHIGNRAFTKTTKVAGNIVIPSTVTFIGTAAFSGMINLTTRDTFKIMGKDVEAQKMTNTQYDSIFGGGTNAIVSIPDGSLMTYAKKYYWESIDLVSSTEIKRENVCYKIIGNEAQIMGYGQTPQGSIQFLDTVKILGKNYLVTSVVDSAFHHTNIVSLVFPKHLASIGKASFRNCNQLQTILFNDGVLSIGERAFTACANVSGNLIIPSSIQKIGNAAFYGLNKLDTIFMQSTLPPTCDVLKDIQYDSIFGGGVGAVIYVPCGSVSAYTKSYYTENLNISSNCETIIDNIIYQSKNETEAHIVGYKKNIVGKYNFHANIKIGENTYSVTEVADSAFHHTSITELSLPSSITAIGMAAFRNCNSLKTISSLGENLLSIGERAFTASSNIDGIVEFPHTLQVIGKAAFYNCNKIANIHLLSQTPPIVIPDGIYTAFTCDEATVSIPCGTFLEYKHNAFWSNFNLVDPCTNLIENVYYTLTDTGMIVVGYDTLPSQLAFKEQVTINGQTKDVVSIANRAFDGVQTLTSVTIPSSVKYVNNCAFLMCQKLSTLTLNEGIKLIGDSCFFGCVFTTLKTPTTLQNIGSYAFRDNSQMKTLVLNEGLEIIGERSFTNNSNLTETLIIPSTVTKVGKAVFTGCDKLTNVIFRGSTPPQVISDQYPVFGSASKFIVPCGSTEAYKTADYWKNLSSKITNDCKPFVLKKGVVLERDTAVSSIAYSRTFDMDVWQTLYLPFEVDSVLVEEIDEGKPYYFDINDPYDHENGGYFYLNEYYTTNAEEATITFSTATTLEGFTPYLIQFPQISSNGYFDGKNIIFKSKPGEYTLKKSDYSQPEATKQFQISGNSSVYNQSVSDMYIFRATLVTGEDGTPLKTVDGKDSVKYDFNRQSSATLKPFEFGLLPYVVEPSSGISSAPMRMSLRIGRSNGNTGSGDITTSVSETHAPNAITYRTGAGELALRLNGLPCQLYSVSGTLLYSSAGGTEEITIPLEKGIYILYSEGKSQKIVL